MNPMKGTMKAKGYNGFICDRLLINSQRHNEGDEGTFGETFRGNLHFISVLCRKNKNRMQYFRSQYIYIINTRGVDG